MIAEDRVKIFYIYSHEEDTWLKRRLDSHLHALRMLATVDWHDSEIAPGKEWNAEIEKHLHEADIILLLISSDFMASEYYFNKVKTALARHDQGETRVIPIILRPVDTDDTPFSKLQDLPTDRRPVASWPDRDEACVNVKRGISKAINEMQKRYEAQRKKEQGLACFWQGRYEEALNLYAESLSLLNETPFDKNKADTLRYIGDALLKLEKYDFAIGAYKQYEETIGGISAIQEPDTAAHFAAHKGEALFKTGNFVDALSAFNIAIEKTPENAGFWQPVIAQIYGERGKELLKENRLGEAHLAFDEALKREPQIAELHWYKGVIYTKQGNIEGAKNAYIVASKLKPDDAFLHKAFGDALLKFNALDEALQEYDKAIELKPDFGYAYKGRSEVRRAIAQRWIKSAEEDEKKFKAFTRSGQ